LDTGRQKNKQIGDDEGGMVCTGVTVAHSTYEGFLFQDICVGVLSLYYNLIQSLLFNSFRINMNFGGSGKLNTASGDDVGGCRFPRTANQAVEEYSFLKTLLTPLIPDALAQSIPEPPECPPHDGHGKKYPTRDQLRAETKVLAGSIIQT